MPDTQPRDLNDAELDLVAGGVGKSLSPSLGNPSPGSLDADGFAEIVGALTKLEPSAIQSLQERLAKQGVPGNGATDVLLLQIATAMRDTEAAGTKAKITSDQSAKQAMFDDKLAKLDEAQKKVGEAVEKQPDQSIWDKMKMLSQADQAQIVATLMQDPAKLTAFVGQITQGRSGQGVGDAASTVAKALGGDGAGGSARKIR